MDAARLLRETSATNAEVVAELIDETEAALVLLRAARTAYTTCNTWGEFDAAYASVVEALRALPVVGSTPRLNSDPL